jgi:hypothetical protein
MTVIVECLKFFPLGALRDEPERRAMTRAAEHMHKEALKLRQELRRLERAIRQ